MISQKISKISTVIGEVANSCGRDATEIKLIGVTKTKPIEMIREAFEAGLMDVGENYVEATKTFIEIQQDHPSLVIKLGFIEGKPLDDAELEAISKLPTRDVLISQLLSVLNQPLMNFLSASQAIPLKLLNLLNNLKDKK